MEDEEKEGDRPVRGFDLSHATYAGWSYALALDARKTLPAAGGATPPGWKSLGPEGIDNGQTFGSGPGSTPVVSGRVSSIAIDSFDSGHLLIGAAGGGIWESRDGGATWAPRTDGQRTLTIGAVAFDPDNSWNAYAGTGEGGGFSNLGLGLLKSVDGGSVWRETQDRQLDGSGFFDLLPLGGDRLLAATNFGLWRSADGGEHWTQILDAITWSLSRLPQGGEILAASADGLRSSIDGESFVGVGLPEPPERFTRLAVRHGSGNPAIAYAFAAMTDGTSRLWRRNPRSSRFEEVPIPSIESGGAGNHWVLAAAVTTLGAETVVLGSVSLFRGVRQKSGAWRWTNLSDRNVGDSIHVDQQAVVFDSASPDTVYVGTDGGLFRSLDVGDTWESLNSRLVIAETLFLAQDPRSVDRMLAGTQDNGTLRYRGSSRWRLVAPGDGGPCAIQQAPPHRYFHTFVGLSLERSEDDGDTWKAIGESREEGDALFAAPLRVLNDLVVQAGEHVWISDDAGDTFFSPDPQDQDRGISLPSGAGRASAIEIVDRDRILVGTETGDLHRIDRDGAGWKPPLPLLQPRAGFISAILAVGHDLWVAYSDVPGPLQGQIFRSTDGGASWKDVSIGTFELPVNALRADPAKAGVLYAATEFGVFRSPDGGDTWEGLNEGLPNALIKDLAFFVLGTDRRLRAATASRGVWEIVPP